ncbi:MAG: cytochrome c oxidase subunit 3 [Flavobacteriales bacterium]|jgi:cytochrome c oxidase subunit 3|nr:cytochrome c oxidase subunit 3 [Flavobacteriales bacterium]MCB0757987.1 cytochrome c oxidase subunit 3 [Flavobacteriales bacterium]
MSDTELTAEQKDRMLRAKKNLTYLLFFSIVMFFAGLTSAYIVSKGSSNYWVNFNLPAPFWWSTVLIVVSSVSMHLALMQARKDHKRSVAPWILLTLALGLGFAGSQVKGWGDLLEDGHAMVARLKSVNAEYGTDYTIERRGETLVKKGDLYYLPEDSGFEHPLNAEMAESMNSASSYFYVLTYAHFAHLIGGLIALMIMSVKALMGRYGKESHQGLWAGTYYWHFLAGLWVYLLLFLAYVH